MKKTNFRGQAAVETAVTMVVLVPLIMYVLFLQEFLNFTLENQEPTISMASDFMSAPNYQKDNGDISGQTQKKFWDHTSAYDYYDDDGKYDGADNHHFSNAVHQCWLTKGENGKTGVLPTCGLSKQEGANGWATGAGIGGFARSDWFKGGVVSCTATLGVTNAYLPNSLWGKFTVSVDGKDKDKGKKLQGVGYGDNSRSDVHKQSGLGEKQSDGSFTVEGGTPSAAWILNEEKHAISSDTWAVNKIKSGKYDQDSIGTKADLATDVMPNNQSDSVHAGYNRSKFYYEKFMKDGVSKSKSWLSDMDKYISSAAGKDTFGEDLDTPGFKHDTDPLREASGKQDSRQGEYSNDSSDISQFK